MPPRKRTVLIVEEDAYLAGIYARRLEQKRCRVTVAETLDDARKKLDKGPFDAIVLDVAVAQGTGFGFLTELKTDFGYQTRPVVVVTRLGDRDSVERAVKSGADAYLIKGHFVPSEAAEKVIRLIDESKGK